MSQLLSAGKLAERSRSISPGTGPAGEGGKYWAQAEAAENVNSKILAVLAIRMVGRFILLA
jgi:hypothetical protein